MIWKRTPLGIALALALVLALSACAAGSPPAQSAAPTTAAPRTTAPATAAPTVEATPSPQPEETATPTPTATPDAPAQGNVLVAYFSHTGNTEAVAEQIAERTGGTLAQIQRAEDYADLQQEAEEEILQGVRPEITVSVDNVEEYDTIFVGYPIWWDEAPAMIATFLESYDFSGKTIVPFCTSASDSIDNSLHIFSELCPEAAIAEGLTANDEADIEPWLQGLGLLP